MKKQHDLEEDIFGFVDTSHRRYKLHRDVEQTPSYRLISLLVSTVTIVQLINTSEAPEIFQYLTLTLTG